MALDWKSVGPEHVRQACETVAASRQNSRTSGIVIWHNERALPAKEVLRTAYRLANQLPAETELRFSSGDSTLRLLSNLGFKVERLEPMSSRPA
jgi:hypothetical protein